MQIFCVSYSKYISIIIIGIVCDICLQETKNAKLPRDNKPST